MDQVLVVDRDCTVDSDVRAIGEQTLMMLPCALLEIVLSNRQLI